MVFFADLTFITPSTLKVLCVITTPCNFKASFWKTLNPNKFPKLRKKIYYLSERLRSRHNEELIPLTQNVRYVDGHIIEGLDKRRIVGVYKRTIVYKLLNSTKE